MAAQSSTSFRAELVETLSLDDELLGALNRLADRCEQVFGAARDIEWAIAGGELYLLQCRAVTRAGPERLCPVLRSRSCGASRSSPT